MSRPSTETKQEGFFINEESAGKRKKIVRQDRLHLDTAKCFLDFQGTKIEILNLSTFGCAALANSQAHQYLQAQFAKEEYCTAKVIFEGTLTQTLLYCFLKMGRNLQFW